MEYTRKCPVCGFDLIYPNRAMFSRAVRENRYCKKCGYIKTGNKQKGFKKNNKELIVLERRCPKCNKHLLYKVYYTWWWANKHDQLCRSCSKKGKPKSEAFKRHLTEVMTGKGNPMYGHRHTQKVKDSISQNNLGNRSKTGQTTGEESKRKMREARLKWIDEHGTIVSYNPTACSYMDSLRPLYNFVHALNGGEFRVCGYSVDGYDVAKNVVFEYDEPHHFDKKGWTLKPKDLKRMDTIKNELGCTFLRYDERNCRQSWY